MSALSDYFKARQVVVTEHNTKENTKLGINRAGNAGLLLASGNSTGSCARVALARAQGIQRPIEERSHNFFEAGFANELRWLDLLKHVGNPVVPESVDIKLEDVIISGSPDVLMYDSNNVLQYGIELKAIAAYKAISYKFYEREPSLEHVIQAAVYQHHYQVPWYLTYTNLSKVTVPFAAKGKGSIPARAYEVDPYFIEFEIKADENGSIWYQEIGEKSKGWQETIITIKGIADYYRSIKMDGELNPRMVGCKIDGGKLAYNPCDALYCKFSHVCDRFDGISASKEDFVEVLKQEFKEGVTC